MGLIGTYTLHLYCDHAAASDEACANWSGIYTGHTNGIAKRAARGDGWEFRPGHPPASEYRGSPFKGACYCANHAGDIPNDLRKIVR